MGKANVYTQNLVPISDSGRKFTSFNPPSLEAFSPSKIAEELADIMLSGLREQRSASIDYFGTDLG